MGVKSMTGNTEPAAAPYASRWAERDARRQENARLAREAAQNRAARNKGVTLTKRVEEAKKVLAGKNVAGAIQTIQTVSPHDYDIYLLAEEFGQRRQGVLKQFGAPRNSVRTAFIAEAGLGSPEDDPDGSEE